jgi:hypothetical protein
MLGLWCDTNHPALAKFPTEAACDWQWTELVRRSRGLNLDRLPRPLEPIVQAIDDWNRNYKLGLLFECKVGPGRLMVCSPDIETGLESRPVARQMRRSLLDYMAGPRFEPQVPVSATELHGLFFDTRIMRKLGARAEGGGADADAILDGDPNTFWSVGGRQRGGSDRTHPYEVTLTFPAPVAMTGVVLMNRQNDRDHLGDIRGYVLHISDDGRSWREVTRGELVSTWQPQTLKFTGSLTAKCFKFTALSGFGADTSAALAELAILYAGPRLPDNAAGEPDFHRLPSTSTDVDEGVPAAARRANGKN